MKILYCLLCLFLFTLGFAQKQKPKKIKNINAEKVEYSPKKYRKHYLFSGKVVFEHEGTKFYCDSAVRFTHNNVLLAWGKVKIKNDTIQLTGDSLKYNGNNKLSEVWEKVRLKDKRQTITSDYMQYNGNSNVATAKGNVVVVDKDRTTKTEKIVYNRQTGVIHNPEKAFIKNKDGTSITSEKGYYNINNKTNDFRGNVHIVDKDYIVDSDRALFNEANGNADVFGNTKIVNRKDPTQYIITNRGTFNTKTGKAILRSPSTVYSDGRELHGDYIEYNDKTGFGKARGNVWLNDPEEQRWIKGDYGESYEQKDSAFVTGNAYAVKAFEKDSLYFHADTIVAVQRIDSTRLIRGYRKAKFYKSNVQGKADSISYNESNGRLNFFRDPIVWSGDQQITGDTIFVYTNPEKEITDSIRVFKNAFVIAKVDSIPEHKEYHQVKGRRLLAIFYENELKWLEIEGNSQSLTFMDEEKKDSLGSIVSRDRVGINRSDCGIIEAQIAGNNVDILACKIEATSKLYPEKDLPEKQRYLPDFNWKGAERMRNWRDMFVDFEAIDGIEDIDFDKLEEITPDTQKPKNTPPASKGRLKAPPLKKA